MTTPPPASKWLFIVNPMAGSGKAQQHWQMVENTARQLGIDFDHRFTTHRNHATEIARLAIEEGYRKIAVVGGDGTFHEVVNGIFQQHVAPPHDITAAIIPLGTGNDWIRTHRLPRNPEKALRAIAHGKTALQDIGKVTFHADKQTKQTAYFHNVAGLAYDAFVTKKSNDEPRFLSNKLLYLYLVLSCLFQYRPPLIRFFFNGYSFEDRFYTINVGICKYSGGGMQLAPHAVPDDGLFALTLVRAMPIFGVILSTPFLYNGKIGDHPKGQIHQTKEIRIEGGQEVQLELDGEFVGHAPVVFEVLPKAFRFIVS